MSLIDLLILAGACWYVSFVLTSTEGPGGVFLWIREHVWHGRHGQVEGFKDGTDSNGMTFRNRVSVPAKNGLLDCIICLAFWIAQGLALATGHTFIEGLAIAGIALMLHRYTGWAFNG